MVAASIPAIGEDNVTAAPKVNKVLSTLLSAANQGFGLGRRIVGGFAGDSISDNDGGGKASNVNSAIWGADSAPFWMLAEHFNADIDFDNKPYANGGYGFALGGSTTSHLLDTQADQIIARPPDVLFVSTFQNDNILDAASATASVNRVIQALEKVLPYLSIGIVLKGVIPKGILSGANAPEAREMANSMIRAWAARTQGVAFVDVLSILKDQTGTPEAAGASASVRFRDEYTYDQVHFTADGARAEGRAYAQAVRKLVAERALIDVAARPYSPSYPWGSYFGGTRALMMGTGGTLDGAASNDIPAGWVVTYPTDGGITFTPSIIVGADGYRRATFTPTGTATKDVILTMTATNAQACEAGLFGAEMLADHAAVEGWGVNFTCPICSVGNDTWTVSGVYTGTRLFRSPRLVPFSNDSSGKTMTISAVVKSGKAPKGSIGVYRASMTRQGNA